MEKAIGIDIGGTSIKYALIQKDGIILKKASLPIDMELSQDQIGEQLLDAIEQMLQESHIFSDEIQGIGIGCPGAINSKTGVCDYSNNLKWKDFHLVELFQERFGIQAKISNDANCAALGECYFGAGKQYQNMILLTLGTGIGGGVVLDGQIYEGNQGKGAELGHMILVMDGHKCSCGHRGCFEAYASATALIRDTKEAMNHDHTSLMWNYIKEHGGPDGRTAFECAKLGDETAIVVKSNYIKYLGEGIISIANIFRPEAVLLSGGVSNQGETLTKPLRNYIKERLYGVPYTPMVDIKIASLGTDTGVYGAAALIFGK